MIGNKPWKYCQLMTNYNVDGGLKFLSVESNRWINSGIPRMNEIQEYVDLEERLIEVLKEHRFPKDQFDFSMNFSVLKSDPGLYMPQHAHTDSAKAFSYGKKPQIRFFHDGWH